MNIKNTNRNDPCPCGSGKKFKQCCQLLEVKQSAELAIKSRAMDAIPEQFKIALQHHQVGELPQAERIYQEIIQLSPKHLDALHNLGLLASETGRHDLAVELLSKARRIEPSAAVYCSLGKAYLGQKNYTQAIESFQHAITLNPAYATAYSNLGTALLTQQKYEEAIGYFHRAIALSPAADSYNNLGYCLLRQGEYNDAIHYCRQAIALNPQFDLAYNNLLFCLCWYSESSADNYLAEARRFDLIMQRQAIPYTEWHKSLYEPNSRLRVGFVSGDFRNHPVGYFLENILDYLTDSPIELIAYNTQTIEDELSERIKPKFSTWHSIAHLNDAHAAKKIHDDGIHILIDLAGHTANNRLSVFTWKPAPIQVSWLGYFASTGLASMDYFLADPISVPIANQGHFSEQIWYLPDTRLCFSPPSPDIKQDISLLPAFSNNHITFGCFQNLSKITPKVLSVWARILYALPTSRLRIKNKEINDPDTRQLFVNKLKALQFPLDQVIFEDGSTREAYFSSYAGVDFMLDTFPFPGGTTTCEALWMGVPTLTLTGNTLLERQGMSMMSCIGLNDWIADDEADYIYKAQYFAQHLNELSILRSTLREQMSKSPLTDAKRFAKNLETALLTMWQQIK